jgi:hypothetical protein
MFDSGNRNSNFQHSIPHKLCPEGSHHDNHIYRFAHYNTGCHLFYCKDLKCIVWLHLKRSLIRKQHTREHFYYRMCHNNLFDMQGLANNHLNWH